MRPGLGMYAGGGVAGGAISEALDLFCGSFKTLSIAKTFLAHKVV